MDTILKGKAFVYGANIDTDQIYPAPLLTITDADKNEIIIRELDDEDLEMDTATSSRFDEAEEASAAPALPEGDVQEDEDVDVDFSLDDDLDDFDMDLGDDLGAIDLDDDQPEEEE